MKSHNWFRSALVILIVAFAIFATINYYHEEGEEGGGTEILPVQTLQPQTKFQTPTSLPISAEEMTAFPTWVVVATVRPDLVLPTATSSPTPPPSATPPPTPDGF